MHRPCWGAKRWCDRCSCVLGTARRHTIVVEGAVWVTGTGTSVAYLHHLEGDCNRARLQPGLVCQEANSRQVLHAIICQCGRKVPQAAVCHHNALGTEVSITLTHQGAEGRIPLRQTAVRNVMGMGLEHGQRRGLHASDTNLCCGARHGQGHQHCSSLHGHSAPLPFLGELMEGERSPHVGLRPKRHMDRLQHPSVYRAKGRVARPEDHLPGRRAKGVCRRHRCRHGEEEGEGAG